jgi:uncharacterized OB-fold protein
MCPHCGSLDWTPQKLSGRGTIYAWLVCRHPSEPEPTPQLAILVNLEEGLRFVSNLVDSENAKVGAPVAVEFGTVKGKLLPLFRTIASERIGK